MFTLPLRRLLGGRRPQRLVLLGLFLLTGWFVVHTHRQRQQQQPLYVPMAEYAELLAARAARPSPWPTTPTMQWQASAADHLEIALLQQHKHPRTSTSPSQLWADRQMAVRRAAKHAWSAYAANALASDEYNAVSRTGTNHTARGIGYFIADVLDSLVIMGLEEEYRVARDTLVGYLTFDQRGSVSLFETTIRVLGGLLAAYHWSGESDQELLRLAVELGERLAVSFNTTTGIPPETAILRSDGMPVAYLSSTAEVGTLQLEFRYLAKLTGRHEEFRRPVDRISQLLHAAEKPDYLAPIYMNAQTARFVPTADIRVGSRGDSYYEYLLKQYLQTQQTEPAFLERYAAAMEGVKKHLVARSMRLNMTFVGELVDMPGTRGQQGQGQGRQMQQGQGQGQQGPKFKPKMDHLVCFLAGNLALGATMGRPLSAIDPRALSASAREDLVLARQLAETCTQMYFDAPTGLAPELVHIWHPSLQPPPETSDLLSASGDLLAYRADRHSLLRPETVESLFILWRITGEPRWREHGWRIFEAFERWTRLDEGYAGLVDVTEMPPVRRIDRMETFWIAETLKYLYLLFDGEEAGEGKVPLTRYVFNTEAHPLPVFKW
ncbi:mannosyl-oligosaccharide alpha-1,2-mannosidase [Coemansia erecta]|uniref:alpha-1,2-Mannosidase n=1 Tax=Coemansia erecta TaxID=147472 RepID=A0A9W7Y412_9FUNG|nr:mannosyl-oligosaccharide alpha-1,2-mannosidase [Coemansia erecta]